MKICLIADTHYGVRNNSVPHLDNLKRFFHEIVFPYLKKNRIKTVVHLGDVVDNRKTISMYTARRLREDFLEPLRTNGYECYFVVGNHDSFYKSSINLNAQSLLLKKEWMFEYIDEPCEIIFDGTKVLLLPWICDGNSAATFEMLKATDAPICMAHLELEGFDYYKGLKAKHGLDKKIFSKFDRVFTGHYHTRSDVDNVSYIGAAGQYIWADSDDYRGVAIYDTETKETTYLENPFRLYRSVHYDETKELKAEELKDCFVRLYVKDDANQKNVDLFTDKLDSVGIHDLQIIREEQVIELSNTTHAIPTDDTLTYLRSYVNEINNIDTQRMNKLMTELYLEAQSS